MRVSFEPRSDIYADGEGPRLPQTVEADVVATHCAAGSPAIFLVWWEEEEKFIKVDAFKCKLVKAAVHSS